VANARLHFASGCVAEITASRAHPTPHRQMHVWGAEGYAGLDFSQKRVTLVQPSAVLRANGLDPSKLDAASRARIKEELFGRHLETFVIDGPAQDQLTRELTEFVQCAQTGTNPRVAGGAGRDAVELAERIIASLEKHAWLGGTSGPVGPRYMPVPTGMLFAPHVEQEVA
jgi:predicted dehydrogenase